MWANIGAFHICLWTFTLAEAWAWGRKEEELVDRWARRGTARHAVRATRTSTAWRRAMLGKEILAVLRPGVDGGRDSSRRRQAAQHGSMTYTFSRKVQYQERKGYSDSPLFSTEEEGRYSILQRWGLSQLEHPLV